MLIASNQSLAEFNLSKEPELISSKERLCEMYDDADKLHKRITEKVNTISKYCCFSFYLVLVHLKYGVQNATSRGSQSEGSNLLIY